MCVCYGFNYVVSAQYKHFLCKFIRILITVFLDGLLQKSKDEHLLISRNLDCQTLILKVNFGIKFNEQDLPMFVNNIHGRMNVCLHITTPLITEQLPQLRLIIKR